MYHMLKFYVLGPCWAVLASCTNFHRACSVNAVRSSLAAPRLLICCFRLKRLWNDLGMGCLLLPQLGMHIAVAGLSNREQSELGLPAYLPHYSLPPRTLGGSPWRIRPPRSHPHHVLVLDFLYLDMWCDIPGILCPGWTDWPWWLLPRRRAV